MDVTTPWLAIANIAFFVFHTALILFNLFGWAHARTRRWQLATLAATACSWFVFGFWRGWGYCLCTDWHMQIREALGIHDRSTMYVQLMIESITGWRPPDDMTMWITGGGFVFGLAMSLIMNVRDWRRDGALTRSDEGEAPATGAPPKRVT